MFAVLFFATVTRTSHHSKGEENGEGKGCIAFVSSVLWVLLYFSMTDFEYEASTCDGIYIA